MFETDIKIADFLQKLKKKKPKPEKNCEFLRESGKML